MTDLNVSMSRELLNIHNQVDAYYSNKANNLLEEIKEAARKSNICIDTLNEILNQTDVTPDVVDFSASEAAKDLIDTLYDEGILPQEGERTYRFTGKDIQKFQRDLTATKEKLSQESQLPLMRLQPLLDAILKIVETVSKAIEREAQLSEKALRKMQ